MFNVVKVSADNRVTLIKTESREIPLKILQDAVNGFIEVVRIPQLPDLAMVVNENGHNLDLPLNVVGSGLYANPDCAVLGDVVFGTFYNPDPEAESDVYAFDSINALKVKSFMTGLIEEYRKAGFVS